MAGLLTAQLSKSPLWPLWKLRLYCLRLSCLSVRMAMTVYSKGSWLFTTIMWKPGEKVVCRRELLCGSNFWSTIPPSIWPSLGMLKIPSLIFSCHSECCSSVFLEQKQWDSNLSKNKSLRLQELEWPFRIINYSVRLGTLKMGFRQNTQ